MEKLNIGILDLQGCVEEHLPHLKALGVEITRVRAKNDFAKIDGLIIPGGESTTQLKLLDRFQLNEIFLETSQRVPFWGICAGSILMAKKVSHPEQKSFALIDVDVDRNAYGRQVESFTANFKGYEVAFIRAPKFTRISDICERERLGSDIVFARDPNTQHQISSFHCELNLKTPSPFHIEFAQRCSAQKALLDKKKKEAPRELKDFEAIEKTPELFLRSSKSPL